MHFEVSKKQENLMKLNFFDFIPKYTTIVWGWAGAEIDEKLEPHKIDRFSWLLVNYKCW
jgi:hypothetical protein